MAGRAATALIWRIGSASRSVDAFSGKKIKDLFGLVGFEIQ